MNREHLIELAARCEHAADTLVDEGEHAAEVLATRANGDQVDPQQWAARKHAAAAAAREYAAGLRAEANSLPTGARPTEARIRQAGKVALAAELGGILIDGSRLAQVALADRSNPDDLNRAIAAHRDRERDAVRGSGVFHHVTENGQVPFWQLGATDLARDADTDEF